MTGHKVTLGPVLFNWPTRTWRDFYARIADEAPVDRVYLGEVVCSKRERLREKAWDLTIERLRRAGKTVALSTLGLVMRPHERHRVFAMVQDWPGLVEANEVTALAALEGRPHAVGPLLNVYNEATLSVLAAAGATIVCLPAELPPASLPLLAAAARAVRVELELPAFGRLPLALSLRCIQAHSRGRTAESCRYLCQDAPDGVPVETASGDPRLVVNGAQTLTGQCVNRVAEVPALVAAGIAGFRLSPQSCDMVAVAQAFRDVLDGVVEPAAAAHTMARLDQVPIRPIRPRGETRPSPARPSPAL